MRTVKILHAQPAALILIAVRRPDALSGGPDLRGSPRLLERLIKKLMVRQDDVRLVADL